MTKDLWTRQWQRILAVGGSVLAVLFLFIGWWGVSGSDLTTEQIPYLASGAVGGLFCLGLSATLWLSADLREEYLKLDDIHQVVEHLGRGPGPEVGSERRGLESDTASFGATSMGEAADRPLIRDRRPLRSGKR